MATPHPTSCENFTNDNFAKFPIISQTEFTDIDQIYRALNQTGELMSGNIAASTTGIGVVAASADKSVQGSSKADGPDIQIVNVPDYPERTGIIDGPGSSSSTGGLSAIAATAVAAAQRAGRGVRPPPVPVPILGVQLQQQELAQQRSGGLPVPQQDVSSSSGPPCLIPSKIILFEFTFLLSQ